MRFNKGIILLAQLLPAACQGIHWTIGMNCVEDLEDQQDAIRGMKTAKDQALYSAKQLERTITPDAANVDGEPDIAEIRRVVSMIIGEEYYESRTGWLVMLLNLFEMLDDEPTGAENNEFESSEAWKNFATEAQDAKDSMHWGNIAVYCGPDLEEKKDADGKTYWYHTPRKQEIKSDQDELVIMKNEMKNDAYVRPGRVFAAITNSHKEKAWDSPPEGELTRIPSTISIHWKHVKAMRAFENIFLDLDLLEVVSQPRVLVEVFGQNAGLPIELSKGLTGILLHEITHAPAFGGLWDEPNVRSADHGQAPIVEGDPDHAYGWTNNLFYKILNNPELVAFVCHCIDMLRLGYTADIDGEIREL